MRHPLTVEQYAGSMQDLAEDIGNLRYDALAEFLHLLADKIQEDGDKDKSRGREKLARELHQSAHHLRVGKVAIDRAWQISEPYM